MEKVKACELCFMTYDGTNKNVAGHILCNSCLKKLKIWKKDTLKKYHENHQKLEKTFYTGKTYKDLILLDRLKHWKHIICCDIELERLNEILKEN